MRRKARELLRGGRGGGAPWLGRGGSHPGETGPGRAGAHGWPGERQHGACPGVHAAQRQRGRRGHERAGLARVQPDLPRQGHAHPLPRLPAQPCLLGDVRPPRGGGGRAPPGEPRPRAIGHGRRVRVRPVGRLVEGRPGPDAAHARHRPPPRRLRLLRRPAEHLRRDPVPAHPARPVRRRRGPRPRRLQRRPERRPSLRGDPSLPGDPRLRAEGAGPARDRLCRPGAVVERGRLLRALDDAAPRGPVRARRAPRPRKVEPARPRTYYRWRDERGLTHVAEAPPPEGTVYSTVRALD